jgi:hypothetical protein
MPAMVVFSVALWVRGVAASSSVTLLFSAISGIIVALAVARGRNGLERMILLIWHSQFDCSVPWLLLTYAILPSGLAEIVFRASRRRIDPRGFDVLIKGPEK